MEYGFHMPFLCDKIICQIYKKKLEIQLIMSYNGNKLHMTKQIIPITELTAQFAEYRRIWDTALPKTEENIRRT